MICPASNPCWTHPAAHTQLWLHVKSKREGSELFACFSHQRLALNLHFESWVQSCSWLSCWPSGRGTGKGMRTGTGPPSFPPSLPDSCRRQLPASRAAQPHGFVAFLPLVTTVPSCFRDAVQRNNRMDCILLGWVPGHLHSQLVWHRSPCFFSDTRGYWWQAGAVLLLLHRCLLLAHLKRTRYPVV